MLWMCGRVLFFIEYILTGCLANFKPYNLPPLRVHKQRQFRLLILILPLEKDKR